MADLREVPEIPSSDDSSAASETFKFPSPDVKVQSRPSRSQKPLLTPTHRSHPIIATSDKLRPLTPIYNKGLRDMGPTANRVYHSSAMQSASISHRALSQKHSSTVKIEKTAGDSEIPDFAPPTRPRGQSRSSSLPGIRVNESDPGLKSPQSSGRITPQYHGKRSVKHLTCFWWKEKGHCRHSDEDCAYAHYDTGLYTDPPRQIIPGEPALAGKSLDRALKKLHLEHNQSSSSLISTSNSAPPTPESSGAPVSLYLTPTRNPEAIRVQADNDFFRNVAEQSVKEKAVLISAVEALQTENKSLKEETHLLKSDNDQLIEERDMLRSVVSQLQNRQQSMRSTEDIWTTSRPPCGARSTGRLGDFGPIGKENGKVEQPIPISTSASASSIKPFSLGSSEEELRSQNKELKNILRNYGMSF